ncbi:hypothetical protein FS842_011233 [Serendipita sp. 407]|nr:hypothetical protein FS842_011233 [Serendipita sp. 407]
MAEALTIASLINLCNSLGTRLNEIVTRYQTTNQTIAAIVTECTMLQLALENVQKMGTSGRTERLKDGTALQRGLDCALTGCYVTLRTIGNDIKRLEVTSDAPENTSWRVGLGYSAKFTFIWKESSMKALLDQLRGQYNALQLLLHAYSLETAEQMRDALISIQDSLSRIQNDADSTRSRRLTRRGRVSQDSSSMTETGIDVSFTASIIYSGGSQSHSSGPPTTSDDQVPNTFSNLPPPPPPPSPPPPGTVEIAEDDDDILYPAASNLFSGSNSKIILSQRTLSELIVTSQLSEGETLEVLKQIQDIAGTDGCGIMQVILQRKNCNVNHVLTLLTQLRDIGSSKHFYSALLSLQNLDYNLKHTVNSLTRLRNLGTLEDYTDSLAFLRRNGYEVLKTQGEIEALKRTCSTPEDFHYTLHYLRTLQYNIAATMKSLDELKKRWTESLQEYSCLLGLLDHNNYEVEDTVQQLTQVMPFLKRKIGLLGRSTEDNIPLRRSTTLQLLRRNKYALDQTITEIQYLCEAGGYPGVPVVPLKVLEGVDYDFAKATGAFKWLKELPLEDAESLLLLQENDYRIESLQMAIDDYKTRLYGQSGNSQLLGTLRFNRFNAQRFIQQHQWALELLLNAPDLQLLLPPFLSKGWHIERLGRMLGSVCTERVQTLLIIGENEEEVIERWLSEMETVLIGIGPAGLATADRLFKEASLDFRVVDEFKKLRQAATDNWGMLLMLSFVEKDPDHDTQLAIRAYKPLSNILRTRKSEFWRFILDLFRNRKVPPIEYSKLLLDIWDNVTYHLNGRMKDAEFTYENVLYCIGAYNYDLRVLLQDLRVHGYRPDLPEVARQARKTNKTIGAVILEQPRPQIQGVPQHRVQRSHTVSLQRRATSATIHRRSQV